MTEFKSKSINIKDEGTWERLVRIAGEMQAKTGKKMIMRDVIISLMDEHEGKGDGQSGISEKGKKMEE